VFKTIFNNISVISVVAVSFIGGGNWSALRNPPTCRKSLTFKIGGEERTEQN
jgi:hypothetical protein